MIGRGFVAFVLFVSLSALAKGFPGQDSKTVGGSLFKAAAGPSSSDVVCGQAECLGPRPGGVTWRTLRVGAGGWLTGIDISPDGSTRLVRTDTYGAYIWNPELSHWDQLVTARSMPSTDVANFYLSGSGVYEIRVAPSQPTRIYMAYNGNVYRSDNRGATFIKTTFANVPMGANDNYRIYGRKMAVDPINPNVVYVGTSQNGLFASSDAGATWQAISSIPIPAAISGNYPGMSGIAFDPTSGQTAGKTNRIYVSSWGTGVYVSNNAGMTFNRTSGGPSTVQHAVLSSTGIYYAADNDGSANNLWAFSANAWTNLPSGNRIHSIAIDPANPLRIIAGIDSGNINQSLDGGATWTGIYWGAYPPNSGVRAATDIPWLAWTNETYMSNGDMIFDPVVPNKLYFSEGIGVWYSNPPYTFIGFDWYSQSAGIEQLVANQVISPPGGKPLVASWDRPVFRIANPDIYPFTHGPDNQYAIVAGWALDYATTNPNFVVGLMEGSGAEKSSFSSDGGQTWHPFASYPPSGLGGCIAASTPSNIIWVQSTNGNPYVTNDGGNTWSLISLPAVPTSGNTGWGFAYYLNRHIVAADRVTSGTFYLYNSLTGLYRSTDGGSTWSLVYSGEISPFSVYNAKLRTVPGQAGNLFFTSGPMGGSGSGHPAANSLMRSTDGGTTWTAVPNVLEVWAFGFGKAAKAGGYPAIFIAGWVNNVYGIYRSDDNAQTWVNLGSNPLGSLDTITTVEGDANTFGIVYLGFSGSGYAFGGL